MWGIIPAAGVGSRIQPLAFSKELLPVGARLEAGMERPRAVSEYLVERLVAAGATRICFVLSPGKADILAYFGASVNLHGARAHFCYVIQPAPGGLCDAIFRAALLINPDDGVMVGLPDTIWFPEDALRALPGDRLSFLLFPVDRPELFDVVITEDPAGESSPILDVREIQVKVQHPGSHWIWGAFKMPGQVFHQLHALWREPGRRDEYVGTLVNAYLSRGGTASAVRAGEAYVDVGTLHGYRHAIQLLAGRPREDAGGLALESRCHADVLNPHVASHGAR